MDNSKTRRTFDLSKQSDMTQVTHSTFGIGTITSEDSKKIVVLFESGEKTLSAIGSRLMNMDGTPYGHQVEVKAAKRTNTQKMMAWEKSLSQEDRNRIEFKNADGTTNWAAKAQWEEDRRKAARESIGE